MPTAENVFEKAKEQFDQPAMLIDVCNDFGRHVEQVRGNPQDAIAGRPRSASLGPAGPFAASFESGLLERDGRAFLCLSLSAPGAPRDPAARRLSWQLR